MLGFLTWVLGLWIPARVATIGPAKPSLQLQVVSSWAVLRVAWVWHPNTIFAAVYSSVLANPASKGGELTKCLRGQSTWLLLRIMEGEGPDPTLRKLYEARKNDKLKVISKMVEPVGFGPNKSFKNKVTAQRFIKFQTSVDTVCLSLCVSVSGCVSRCVCQSVLSVCVSVQCMCMCLWMPEERARSSSWGYR